MTTELERTIEDHRAPFKSRLELVLVHPAGPLDPRGTSIESSIAGGMARDQSPEEIARQLRAARLDR